MTSDSLPDLPPTARMAAGFVLLGTGIALAATGAYEADFDPRAVIAVPAALMFVFGGALFLLPPALAPSCGVAVVVAMMPHDQEEL